eukprot:TRINITY_DN31622_c0_g1_i1.p1 TRINITY_DN31622_c0_g1~~TRINITY_DN31622_c0_g1_i1.p1  ORF type:complete len:305 (+),score=55.52 TRINITY_DN31622_c0_g1_i1:76-990(+)
MALEPEGSATAPPSAADGAACAAPAQRASDAEPDAKRRRLSPPAAEPAPTPSGAEGGTAAAPPADPGALFEAAVRAAPAPAAAAWEDPAADPGDIEWAQGAPALLLPGACDEGTLEGLCRARDAARANGARPRTGHGGQSGGAHEVTFLHKGGAVWQEAPEAAERLRSILLCALRRLKCCAEHPPDSELSLRTAEFHEYGPGAELDPDDHTDAGSLLTMVVAISRPGADHCGGASLAIDGRAAESPRVALVPQRGDAVVFPSLKRHGVAPVASGLRRVVVAELWRGPRLECDWRPYRTSAMQLT